MPSCFLARCILPSSLLRRASGLRRMTRLLCFVRLQFRRVGAVVEDLDVLVVLAQVADERQRARPERFVINELVAKAILLGDTLADVSFHGPYPLRRQQRFRTAAPKTPCLFRHL